MPERMALHLAGISRWSSSPSRAGSASPLIESASDPLQARITGGSGYGYHVETASRATIGRVSLQPAGGGFTELSPFGSGNACEPVTPAGVRSIADLYEHNRFPVAEYQIELAAPATIILLKWYQALACDQFPGFYFGPGAGGAGIWCLAVLDQSSAPTSASWVAEPRTAPPEMVPQASSRLMRPSAC